jgi:hypothetical protein
VVNWAVIGYALVCNLTVFASNIYKIILPVLLIGLSKLYILTVALPVILPEAPVNDPEDMKL